MDALSDVLRAVRLTGAIFFDIHASEPWVAETPAGQSIASGIFPVGSPEENWIPNYQEQHGGLVMGMIRAGGPVGRVASSHGRSSLWRRSGST